MSEQQEYKLYPIGRLTKNGNRYAIKLEQKYFRGLKQLEKFSHIRFFWQRQWAPCNPLGLSTAEINELDRKRGIVDLKPGPLPANVAVLDIKPYLPVDDTVNQVKHFKEANSGQVAAFSKQYLQATRTVNSVLNQKELIIVPVGKIIKKGRKIYIDIFPVFRNELTDLAAYSHVNLIWYFSRLDNAAARQILVCSPPYEAPKTGVFACRAPVRPNPLALSVCRIKSLDPVKGRLEINETDALDGTPVIDLKPYTRNFDRAETVRVPEWLSHWPEYIPEESKESAAGSITQIKPAEIYSLQAYSQNKPSDNKILQKPKIAAAYRKREQEITIYGARQHNLKNITVSIPIGKMTIITGVSGSGKSSLAFDTLYAEGQRRYMQSLSGSSAAHSFLEKPDFDDIQNLMPVVAIEQKMISRNPRSTVGSSSDVYSYLRLLFARIGRRHCIQCGREILAVTPETLIKTLSGLIAGTEIRLFPGKKPAAKANGAAYTINSDIFEDRELYSAIKQTITDCYARGNGFITIEINEINRQERVCVTERPACTSCSTVYFKMSPSLFSYNSPTGMCPACNGLGVTMEVDPDKVIPNPEKSLLDGASPWYGDLRKHRQKPNANWMRGEVLALADRMQVDLELPWNKLPQEFRQKALYGTGDEKYTFTYQSPKTGRSGTIERPVGGALNHLKRLFTNSRASNSHEVYKFFLSEQACPDCRGERLSAQGRVVTVLGKRYPEIAGVTVGEALEWLKGLSAGLSEQSREIAGNIIQELSRKLEALIRVGLDYLPLDRPVTTLSGGEGQRIRLAGQLGGGLSGLLFILDEPSAGLHARDHQRMIGIIKNLKEMGNTIVIVEHDRDTMLAAEHLIDIGPGAGINGGRLVAQGTVEDLMKCKESVTGAFLKDNSRVEIFRRKSARGIARGHQFLELEGARLHNLKQISVKIPLGRLTCVTGVSGSGKSSLIQGTLVPALLRTLKGLDVKAGAYSSIKGLENFDKIISVDQSSIGRSSRSIPATYIGVFDEIRNAFARTQSAVIKKYPASRFSFNDKRGQCRTCGGLGSQKIDMSFLPDTWVACKDCDGKRYNAETLDIFYKDKNIADVLDMDTAQALELFADEEKIVPFLKTMQEVGLDYLKLGQSSASLSGGEAQRIKLALELSRPETGSTLYILDEPTSGLHFADIQKLLKVLHALCDLGNTVVIIEHNLDVIKTADWIIDLGPEGGLRGGYLIGQGNPRDITKIRQSHTGQVLKNLL